MVGFLGSDGRGPLFDYVSRLAALVARVGDEAEASIRAQPMDAWLKATIEEPDVPLQPPRLTAQFKPLQDELLPPLERIFSKLTEAGEHSLHVWHAGREIRPENDQRSSVVGSQLRATPAAVIPPSIVPGASAVPTTPRRPVETPSESAPVQTGHAAHVPAAAPSPCRERLPCPSTSSHSRVPQPGHITGTPSKPERDQPCTPAKLQTSMKPPTAAYAAPVALPACDGEEPEQPAETVAQRVKRIEAQQSTPACVRTPSQVTEKLRTHDCARSTPTLKLEKASTPAGDRMCSGVASSIFAPVQKELFKSGQDDSKVRGGSASACVRSRTGTAARGPPGIGGGSATPNFPLSGFPSVASSAQSFMRGLPSGKRADDKGQASERIPSGTRSQDLRQKEKKLASEKQERFEREKTSKKQLLEKEKDKDAKAKPKPKAKVTDRTEDVLQAVSEIGAVPVQGSEANNVSSGADLTKEAEAESQPLPDQMIAPDTIHRSDDKPTAPKQQERKEVTVSSISDISANALEEMLDQQLESQLSFEQKTALSDQTQHSVLSREVPPLAEMSSIARSDQEFHSNLDLSAVSVCSTRKARRSVLICSDLHTLQENEKPPCAVDPNSNPANVDTLKVMPVPIKLEPWQILREQVLPPKNLDDNYQISEPADSDDETSVDRTGKHVPKWSCNFVEQADQQSCIDPDTIFGSRVPHCELETVFSDELYKKVGRSRPKRVHGSSGDWRKDRLTHGEIHGYKNRMGHTKSWKEIN